MADLSLEALSAQITDLQRAVNELLTRVRGPLDPAAPGETVPLYVPGPVFGEGIASYVQRVAAIVGGDKGAQAIRSAGSLIGGAGQALVDKHSGDWRAAAWEYITGDPAYVADPRWGDYRPGQ